MAERELLLQEALGDEVAAGIVDVFQRQGHGGLGKAAGRQIVANGVYPFAVDELHKIRVVGCGDPLDPLRNVLMRSS